MFEINGKVLYSPVRNNIKSHNDIVVLHVEDEELCTYHSWFILKRFGIKTNPSMFGSHVTIVKPQEVDTNHDLWKKYESKIINVQYGKIERHWEFWSLNIYSDDIVEMRRELGLNLNYRLHMTIGRQDSFNRRPVFDGVEHEQDFLDFISNKKIFFDIV